MSVADAVPLTNLFSSSICVVYCWRAVLKAASLEKLARCGKLMPKVRENWLNSCILCGKVLSLGPGTHIGRAVTGSDCQLPWLLATGVPFGPTVLAAKTVPDGTA